jgi:hypothetical protein
MFKNQIVQKNNFGYVRSMYTPHDEGTVSFDLLDPDTFWTIQNPGFLEKAQCPIRTYDHHDFMLSQKAASHIAPYGKGGGSVTVITTIDDK